MTEQDIVQALQAYLPLRYMQRRAPWRTIIVPEVDGPFRRPDLIQLDLYERAGDLDSLMHVCSIFRSEIMSQLYSHLLQCGRSTREAIEARIRWGPSTIRRYLAQLVHEGWLDNSSNGVYSLTARRVPAFRLSTFEVKLSDWRRASTQLSSHAMYADRSILVMPAPTRTETRWHLEERLERVNAGLILADMPNSAFEVARWPAMRLRPCAWRLWALGCTATGWLSSPEATLH